jgi:serine/threonine-protein kinase
MYTLPWSLPTGEEILREGSTFILMEKVKNRDLTELLEFLKGKFLPLVVLNKITKGLIYGLNAFHSILWLHLDLKLENVLLDDEGNVRLVDFGSARSYSPSSSLGLEGGTFNYMCPRRLMNYRSVKQHKIPPYPNLDLFRSEVFSLGLMVFVLFFKRFLILEYDFLCSHFEFNESDSKYIEFWNRMVWDPKVQGIKI